MTENSVKRFENSYYIISLKTYSLSPYKLFQFCNTEFRIFKYNFKYNFPPKIQMLFFSKLKRDWKECEKCNCDEKKKKNLEINSNQTFPLRSFAFNFWIYLFIFLFLLSLFALTLSRDKTNNTENDRFVFQRIHGLSTSLCIVNTSCITCLSNNNAIPKDASSSFP